MNFNSLINKSKNIFLSNNYKNPSPLKDEQKYELNTFRFQDHYGTYNPYIENEDNKEFFYPNKILNEPKNVNTSKIEGKFDISFEHINIDNKEHICNKNISLLNKEKDSLYLLKTNFLSKKAKEESAIKDITLKNAINFTMKDNIIRKCKNFLLSHTRKFINDKIKEIYNSDIGGGIWKKEILDINSEQKSDNKINTIKNLLKKTLKDIFSTNISLRYTSYLFNHNEIIIQKLLNENDESKKEKFQKLFNITFSDCLKKFVDNSNECDELEGFPNFDDIKSDLKDDKECLEKMKNFFLYFEDIIKSKKPRNRNLFKNNTKKEKDNYKLISVKQKNI